MLREISEWDLGNILLKPILQLLSKLNCRIKLPQDESQKYKLNQKAIRDISGLKVLADLLNAKLETGILTKEIPILQAVGS